MFLKSNVLSTFTLLLFTLSINAQDSTPKITKDFVLGKFDFKKDDRFIKVDSIHSNKEIYLQKEVYAAYQKMYDSAFQSGIKLIIVSGTRNYYAQKWIWERKWDRYKDLKPKDRALKILEFSSMPNTSRHHWGTDVDLVNLNNEFFAEGDGKKIYDWLQTHAHKFGFYLVYTDKSEGRTGYNEERWHWTYLPLSKQYLDFYNSHIRLEDIKGFLGSELASELDVIQKYVNGVSEELKE